jgi:hypothetical protein
MAQQLKVFKDPSIVQNVPTTALEQLQIALEAKAEKMAHDRATAPKYDAVGQNPPGTQNFALDEGGPSKSYETFANWFDDPSTMTPAATPQTRVAAIPGPNTAGNPSPWVRGDQLMPNANAMAYDGSGMKPETDPQKAIAEILIQGGNPAKESWLDTKWLSPSTDGLDFSGPSNVIGAAPPGDPFGGLRGPGGAPTINPGAQMGGPLPGGGQPAPAAASPRNAALHAALIGQQTDKRSNNKPGVSFLEAKGQNTSGMTAGELANALNKSIF